MLTHQARYPARSIRAAVGTPFSLSWRRGWATRLLVLAILVGTVMSGIGPASVQKARAGTAPAVDGPGTVPVPSPPSGPPRPLPPGLPPFFPIIPLAQWEPGGASSTSIFNDLESAIAGVQQVLDAVSGWVRSAREATGNAIAEIVAATPGDLPQGVDLARLVGSMSGLPDDLRRMLTAVLAAWRSPAQPGTPVADHQAYVSANPSLANDAIGIAATSAAVAAGNVRQQVAVSITSKDAAAVAADPALPAAALAARQVGAALLQGAPQLPSSRAGIEMLVAGMGAGMQQQADLDTALAERLTVLAQQLAAVSQQMGTLGETTAALAARDAERDRRELDARLGLMDAVRAGGQALSQMLAGAGEPSDVELPLVPLY
ncbi:MAG TPA: hypothetical protein VEZ44_15190 [bacterium]|nr:hypothetical protein [bacterium]